VAATVLLAVSLISPLVFAGMLWLTRAGAKRAQAAIIGCLVAAVFSLCWDALAVQMHWWTFPSSSDLLATLALSISGVFLFGGTAGLIGWRMMRSGGWTGAATFISGFVGLGLLRDHLLDANTTLFDFGAGPIGQIMAGVGYLSLALIVQITMLIVGGHPRRDELRAN
jgi:hypothetical protein